MGLPSSNVVSRWRLLKRDTRWSTDPILSRLCLRHSHDKTLLFDLIIYFLICSVYLFMTCTLGRTNGDRDTLSHRR